MASSTATNPILKALSMSVTSLHSPSIHYPTKTHLQFRKPISKIPFFLSLTLQNPTFFPSTSVSCVAQTSEWEQEGSSPNAVLDEEVTSWDAAAAADDDERPEEPQASGFGGESEAEGEGGVGGEEGFPEPPEDAKLFVGNLPFDIDSEKLAQLFDSAGVVEISEVIYNRETDRSRGFGFVTMSTVEEADKAVEIFNRYDLNGRLLTVNKAAPRGARLERPPREFEPSFRIYVGNLPWDVDSPRLEQVFSEHGKVLSARVVSDRESGRSRGFGFVTMASETEMNDAIAALDGQTLNGRAIRVNVAEDRPRRTF